MLLPLKGFDESALAELLKTQYDCADADVAFSPLGEDSWQYRVGPLWVSVRRDIRGHEPGAYAAAAELRDGVLPFVLAPLAGRDGRVVHRVDDRPVVVFPYLPVTQLAAGSVTRQDIDAVEDMVRRTHAATVDVELPVEDYALSFDHDLDEIVAFAAGRVPDTGPYAERFARLLRDHDDHVAGIRADVAQLSETCRADDTRPVLTHGEPSAANVLRHGALLLLGDWGGAGWGPPERDWFHVGRTLPCQVADRCHTAQLRFYELRWTLSEIAEYGSIFMREHGDDADTAAMWRRLLRYLPGR